MDYSAIRACVRSIGDSDSTSRQIKCRLLERRFPSALVLLFILILMPSFAWVAPVVASFSPAGGSAETVLVINGSAFGANVGVSRVFDFHRAERPTSGPISVTVAGDTATTSNDFQIAEAGSTLFVDGATLMASTVAAGQYIDLSFTAVAGDDLGLGLTSVVQNPVSSSKKPYVSGSSAEFVGSGYSGHGKPAFRSMGSQ